MGGWKKESSSAWDWCGSMLLLLEGCIREEVNNRVVMIEKGMEEEKASSHAACCVGPILLTNMLELTEDTQPETRPREAPEHVQRSC